MGMAGMFDLELWHLATRPRPFVSNNDMNRLQHVVTSLKKVVFVIAPSNRLALHLISIPMYLPKLYLIIHYHWVDLKVKVTINFW